MQDHDLSKSYCGFSEKKLCITHEHFETNDSKMLCACVLSMGLPWLGVLSHRKELSVSRLLQIVIGISDFTHKVSVCECV